MSKEIIKFVPTPKELSSMSKKALQAKAEATAGQISSSGAFNNLEVYIRTKKLVDYATALAGAIKGKAEDEARLQQGTGKFEKFGATITHTSTGTKWYYGNCNDPYLDDLEAEAAELKKKIENRQKYLQGISENGEEYIYPKTSEVVTLRKAVKTSSEGISITY